jgi:hypothetical protein
MRARWALWAVLATSGVALAACGGSSADGSFGKSDSGGGASPGSSGGGGGGGGKAGGAGQVGSGGSAGSAGASAAPGTGGALAGDPGPCPAPTAAGTTRICLTLSPEKITPKADPALDERGILVVQVFDTPTPPDKNAGQIALAERVFPKDAVLGGADGAVGPEIALGDLKEMRFENAFPATVYIRAFFVDNPEILGKKDGSLGYGVWLGGVNLADGITDKEPLTAVPLNVGQGNAVNLSLTAFRRLKVTVHRTVTALGDGQGPLNVIAVNNADPAKKPPAFGFATHKCADVVAGDVTLNGFVVGAGPLWAVGVLNDLGSKGDLPPGALASLDVTPTTYRIPTELAYAATDYVVDATINLNYVIPWDADAGPIPPNSCADLASKPDGG